MKLVLQLRSRRQTEPDSICEVSINCGLNADCAGCAVSSTAGQSVPSASCNEDIDCAPIGLMIILRVVVLCDAIRYGNLFFFIETERSLRDFLLRR